MILIQRGAAPDILDQLGQQKARALCEDHDQGNDAFDFDSAVYGHETVKQALIDMQHGKCCFCESKILHIAFGDVEHYRPKAGYRQNPGEALRKPGYYWLAYAWDNLLLSCERCNRQYKKNLFPLLDQERRSHCHRDDIAMETPLLINPTMTDPKNHIGFRDEIPYPVDGSLYGKTTIAALGLDREELNEIRRTKLDELRRLADLIKLAEARPNQADLRQLAEKAHQFLLKAIAPQAEYSAMTTAALAQ